MASAPSTATLVSRRRRLHPMRHCPGNRLDIRCEQSVVAQMVGGMFADDIDDPGACPLEIVQVGKSVGQSGTKMEKRRGGFAGHPVIAVRGARRYRFVQTQNATHAVDLVEGGHKMHFRRAGIGEADFHATGHQGPNEAFGSVHFLHCSVTHFSGEKDVGTRCGFRGRLAVAWTLPNRRSSRAQKRV